MITLLALLLVWVSVRVVTWQSPFPVELPTELPTVFAESVPAAGPIDPPVAAVLGEQILHETRSRINVYAAVPAPMMAPMPQSLDESRPAYSFANEEASGAGHQALVMAAMGHVPVPMTVLTAFEQSVRQTPADTANEQKHRVSASRLRVDAWVFVRPGGSSALLTGSGAQYGGSQLGGVWSYPLDPGNARRTAAYMRVTKALSGARETDGAFGVSARPIGSVPVTAHAELRATRIGGRTLLRPQAFVTAQLPAHDLGLGVQATAYGQAGYVGGEFATAFADGQAVVDREVAQFDLAKLRVGAGAWGGGQEGATRLDVGPRLSLDVEIADAPARIAVDYRVRVAGNAEPGNGVAITLSTGF